MRNKYLWLISGFLLTLLVPVLALSFDLLSAVTQTREKQDGPAPAQPDKKSVLVITVDAPITPVVSEYIIKSIDSAAKDNAEALIIELDTPGGLVDSTREIVKKMLVAEVPVVVYVAPSGARAASAGVFITMAGHIAAMAPGTHIGAAHPVTMQGKMDETMETKIVNDVAAMARNIAERRGRNARWAEDAVRKSVSITDTEALKENVIDLIVPDVQSLVAKINGMTVDLVIGKKTIDTSNVRVEEAPMGFRFKFLEVISNPNIAYILMILGFYGIYFELANPGAIFPGVAGAICLILAFYALHTLPINYAGLMLIILGVALFIAEAFVTSGGILGTGGVIAMAVGSVMLIDSPLRGLRISWAVIIPVVGLSALLFIVTVTIALRVHRQKADTGMEGMLGLIGEARTDISAGGQVFVHGETWSARSDEPIAKGERIRIEAIEGLVLKVKKVS